MLYAFITRSRLRAEAPVPRAAAASLPEVPARPPAAGAGVFRQQASVAAVAVNRPADELPIPEIAPESPVLRVEEPDAGGAGERDDMRVT